jgi:AcrR family transcriptional regulator
MGDQQKPGRPRLSRAESRERIVSAATELLRQSGYASLNVGAIMERAGIGRTLFYRHFEDIPGLLMAASREAIGDLYASEMELERSGVDVVDGIHSAISSAVAAYHRHGPLLRALAEAAPGDERIEAGQNAIRERFDELVGDWLARMPRHRDRPRDELLELGRALNLLNTSFLLDAFGGEPRLSEDEATRVLTEIWLAVGGD